MKRILKISGILILIIVVLFAIFICEESIRLKNNKEALPLIIFNKTANTIESMTPGEEFSTEYESFGYKYIVRYTVSEKSHDDLMFVNISGEEFMLFNKIRLWAWIS